MARRTFLVALTTLALLGVACGAADQPAIDESAPGTTAPATSADDASTVPTTTPAPEGTNAERASERPAPDPSREIAPDFSLQLAGGSTFVLSEETRPVFMVFWAEW